MVWTGPLEAMDEFRYRVPKTAGMNTDAVIYVNSDLLPLVKKDMALEQVVNVASMPDIVGSALAMPDVHQGYGFPIGGVAAFDAKEGVISPGGVGYDINCGVRLVRTDLEVKDIKAHLKELVDTLFRNVPSGVGSEGRVHITHSDIQRVLEDGARWAVENGYGWERDLEVLEAGGCLEGADASSVSERAKRRGMPQLGSLGAGNHFLEIQVVDDIYLPDIARAFGIAHRGQVVVMIHTGSRGLGYQVCDDSIHNLARHFKKDGRMFVSREWGISLRDRELVCAPVESESGQSYIKAMKAAANYAWTNRQMIVHWVRESFESVLGEGAEDMSMEIVYDVAHNIAKFERHIIGGRERDIVVHRKGATRAFGPGREEITPKYRKYGQPVLIPGDMGTASYLLVGTEKAMTDTFGSTCHGAGRVLSRRAAVRQYPPQMVERELSKSGIYLRAATRKVISEEAPEAYKSVDSVVEVTHGAGISLKVAKFTPLGVVKG